jgi:hypothetical protein
MFVLQALAESAARAEKPFLLLTILRQALDRHTAHISAACAKSGRTSKVALRILPLKNRSVGMPGLLAEQCYG